MKERKRCRIMEGNNEFLWGLRVSFIKVASMILANTLEQR